MQPAIKMALRTARQSSDFLKDQFARLDPANQKADSLLKTLDAIDDTLLERSIEQLKRAYPDHFMAPAGEVDAGDAERSWHVFPLLGRQNFSRGLPEFVTALLQKRNNRAENLVLSNPMTGEEYAFSRGYGAVLNSRRIRVRKANHLDQTLLCCNLANQAREGEDGELRLDMAGALMRSGASLRYSGCPALDMARVAAGNLDGAVLSPLEPAEQVMGTLISQESGALSGDARGNPLTSKSRELVIANNAVFREILKALKPYHARLG